MTKGNAIEAFFVSILLQSRDACLMAKDRVSAKDFSDPFYEKIVGTMYEAPDTVPWQQKCLAEAMGILPGSGEYQTLSDLYSEAFSGCFDFNAMGSAQVVDDAIHGISERGKKRFVAQACEALSQKCLEPDTDLKMIQAELSEIDTRLSQNCDRKTWDNLVHEWWEKFQDKYDAKPKPSHLGTGMPTIDSLIQKFKPGELVIISAKRKVGKSAFMIGIVNRSSVEEQTPGLVLTLEMGIDEWFDRLIAHRTRIDSERIFRSLVSEMDITKVYHEMSQVLHSPIRIKDSDCFTVAEIESVIKLHKHKRNIEYAIIDHAQLIQFPSGNKNDNRTTELDKMGARLKNLAKKLGITIFLLSQTNDRGVTFGASMLEAHLTKLIRIEIPEEEDEHTSKRYVNLLLNRSGKTGGVEAIFDGATCRFSEVCHQEPPKQRQSYADV